MGSRRLEPPDRYRSGYAAGALLLALLRVPALAAGPCEQPPVPAAVAAAIFLPHDVSCDVNDDGAVSAADVTAAVRGPQPTPSPTVAADTPTPDGTPPIPTPTPTPTSTPPPTATARRCATAGADLSIEIDNRSGINPVTVMLTGERVADDCDAGGLNVFYNLTLDCAGSGANPCVRMQRLAPGSWRHSVQVLSPDAGQAQYVASLLVADTAPNYLRFTAFPSVIAVRTTNDKGDGSLRQALQGAAALPKPLLIEFDPVVFPPGVPTTIRLDTQLPVLDTDDVTIDGTDPSGAVGTRVIDAGERPITALVVTGARNRIIGLRLQNVGGGNRDVVNIAGPLAQGNVLDRCFVQTSGGADGIGIDDRAGADFADTPNIVRECDVSAAADKGIKVTTGAHARVERSWIHDNVNGGVQATLGGHVQVWQSLVERNRGGTAQNGLSANASDDGTGTAEASELQSWGTVARANGANGVSVRGLATADLRDDYLAANGSSGLRVFNDVGPPAQARVEGASLVCNAVDGAVVANTSTADFGGGTLGSAGNNGFTQNNLPAGGSNFRNATTLPVQALNNQWEHCGRGATCDDAAIAALDLSDHGVHTTFAPAQAQRAPHVPVVTGVAPTKGREGELLRIFGTGFNVIDGHFAQGQCDDVTGRNRCVPLRGNCVRINGVSAPVEAVTPTMLVVRWPFTCTARVLLVVTIDLGTTGATSVPVPVCTNESEATP